MSLMTRFSCINNSICSFFTPFHSMLSHFIYVPLIAVNNIITNNVKGFKLQSSCHEKENHETNGRPSLNNLCHFISVYVLYHFLLIYSRLLSICVFVSIIVRPRSCSLETKSFFFYTFVAKTEGRKKFIV
jgi:hypothetical protein